MNRIKSLKKKRLKIFKVILFLFFYTTNVLCQNERLIDSTSIISHSNKFTVAVNVDTQTNAYVIKSNNIQDFRLASNNQYKIAISLDFEFIGVSVGFSPDFLPANSDNELKGESTFDDIGFRFFLGNWTQEVHYKKIQSYYVKNTRDFVPNWNDGVDPFLQFPDFKTIFWGGSTSYILNPNFSYRNVVYNTETQVKNAGSFVPSLFFDYNHISYTFNNSKFYNNSYNINLAPAYYYTLVLKGNWFASVYLSPSVGLRFYKKGKYNSVEVNKEARVPLALNGGLKLGYDSGKLIFGGSLSFENAWHNKSTETTIVNNSFYAKVYFGYRFPAPKSITRSYKWINKKFNF